ALLRDLEAEPLFGEALLARVLEHERVVDPGHRVAREFDVDHRADALDDGSRGLSFCHGVFLVALAEFGFPSHPLLILRRGAREAGEVVEGICCLLPHTAAAPPTISEISFVIPACRFLL